MKWPSWNRLLLPTLLVGCMWLVCSSATTYAILWLERGYQSMLNENVTTIESVGEMHHALLTLQDSVFEQATLPPAQRQVNFDTISSTAEFRLALEKADHTALTAPEQELVGQIKTAFGAYLADLRLKPAIDKDPIPGERAIALAARISSLSDKLLEINQQLIDEHTVFYDEWSQRIRWAGMTLTVLGPLLGAWLGMRASSQLRQRIMRLRVTLASVSGDLGPIDVSPEISGDEFVDLDQQARAAANRIEDILKQLESARSDALRNERLAVVGQLAAGVAHELRNPLTSIKLLVQTAASQAGSNHDDREPFEVVQTEIERMERTIQSLLDFARPPVQQWIRHDLRATVTRAVNLVQPSAERDGVAIDVRPHELHMPVTADPDLLQQVFVNLLLNGIDAVTSAIGSIEISFQGRTADSSDFTNGCHWRVLVRDHGSGISEGETEHIFEPFVTTKARGTGLGLAVSRRIIEEHHGRLTARNHPDGGAVFVVELPFAND